MPTLSDILYNGDYSLNVNGKSKHLGTEQNFSDIWAGIADGIGVVGDWYL